MQSCAMQCTGGLSGFALRLQRRCAMNSRWSLQYHCRRATGARFCSHFLRVLLLFLSPSLLLRTRLSGAGVSFPKSHKRWKADISVRAKYLLLESEWIRRVGNDCSRSVLCLRESFVQDCGKPQSGKRKPLVNGLDLLAIVVLINCS